MHPFIFLLAQESGRFSVENLLINGLWRQLYLQRNSAVKIVKICSLGKSLPLNWNGLEMARVGQRMYGSFLVRPVAFPVSLRGFLTREPTAFATSETNGPFQVMRLSPNAADTWGLNRKCRRKPEADHSVNRISAGSNPADFWSAITGISG